MAKIDLTQQVQGILPVANGGTGTAFGIQFVDAEIPSGAVDGVNSTYTLAQVPFPPLSLCFFVSPAGGGASLLFQGVDYTLVGSQISVNVPPVSGSFLRTWYRTNGSSLTFRDQLVMNDSFGRVLQFQIQESLSDSLSLVDSISFFLRQEQLYLVERLIQREAIAQVMSFEVKLADTLTMSDSFTKQIAISFQYVETLADTLTMGDSITMVIAPLPLLVMQSDLLLMSDNIALLLS